MVPPIALSHSDHQLAFEFVTKDFEQILSKIFSLFSSWFFEIPAGHFHEGRPDFLQKTAIVEK